MIPMYFHVLMKYDTLKKTSNKALYNFRGLLEVNTLIITYNTKSKATHTKFLLPYLRLLMVKYVHFWFSIFC